MSISNKKAFTLIELIVTVAIIGILATISFISFQSSVKDSRDAARKADMTTVKIALKSYKQKSGAYPDPGLAFNITNSGSVEVLQGFLDNSMSIDNLQEIPKDPLSNTYYMYGVTVNKQEFELGMTLENDGNLSYNNVIPKAMADGVSSSYVSGDYKTTAKNLLPSLLLAVSVAQSGSIEINENIGSGTSNDGSKNRLKFILSGSKLNLPYNFDKGGPVSNVTSFSGLINENGVVISADTSFSSCADVLTGEKYFGPGSYEIHDNYLGDLVTTNCDCSGGIGVGTCSLTGVIYASCTLSGTTVPHLNNITAYTGSTIAWNASYDCTNISQSRTCNNGTLSGDSTYQYTSCVKGTPTNCTASGSFINNGHIYSIPALNHLSGATNITSSDISENNGIFNYTLSTITCDDGAYASANENSGATLKSCNSGYYQSGNTCLPLVNGACSNNLPANAAFYNNTTSYSLINATGGTTLDTLTAGYSASPSINTCQFKCTGGYTNSGSTCVSSIITYTNIDGLATPYIPDSASGSGRFSFVSGSLGSGVVLDSITGLSWQSQTGSSFTWTGAINYCNTLTGGYSAGTWRLPDYTELQSIINYAKSTAPAVDTTYFLAQSSYYWSSTTYAPNPTTYAWFVSFSNGGANYTFKTTPYYVRCVR